MSRSMLAAVQEAARGTGEPENRDGMENPARNPFVAGFTAAVDWMIGRGEAAEPASSAKSSAEQPAPPRPQPDATTVSRGDAADIVAMCTAAGFPTMAAALIKDGVSISDAKTRVDGAKEIKAAVDLARKTSPQIPESQADAYVSAGTPIEQVRADLFTKMSTLQSAEITSAHQPGQSTSSGGGTLQARAPDYSEIYAKRAKARASWTPGMA